VIESVWGTGKCMRWCKGGTDGVDGWRSSEWKKRKQDRGGWAAGYVRRFGAWVVGDEVLLCCAWCLGCCEPCTGSFHGVGATDDANDGARERELSQCICLLRCGVGEVSLRPRGALAV
jgi:hypothetical protein